MRKKDEQEEQQVCPRSCSNAEIALATCHRPAQASRPKPVTCLAESWYLQRTCGAVPGIVPADLKAKANERSPAKVVPHPGKHPPSPVRLSTLLTGYVVQARLVCSRDRAWQDIRIPADMGMDCGHYKWYQNQSIVELAFPVPESVQPKEV